MARRVVRSGNGDKFAFHSWLKNTYIIEVKQETKQTPRTGGLGLIYSRSLPSRPSRATRPPPPPDLDGGRRESVKLKEPIRGGNRLRSDPVSSVKEASGLWIQPCACSLGWISWRKKKLLCPGSCLPPFYCRVPRRRLRSDIWRRNIVAGFPPRRGNAAAWSIHSPGSSRHAVPSRLDGTVPSIPAITASCAPEGIPTAAEGVDTWKQANRNGTNTVAPVTAVQYRNGTRTMVSVIGPRAVPPEASPPRLGSPLGSAAPLR